MSKTNECKRCGGSGFFGPVSVCGGRCFACGKSGAAPVASREITRETIILTLASMLQAAKRNAAEGDLHGWIARVSDPECAPYLPGLLAAAPADVRARFEAAMAKLA